MNIHCISCGRFRLFIEHVSSPNSDSFCSYPGSFAHRCSYLAPYVRIKARRAQAERKTVLLTS